MPRPWLKWLTVFLPVSLLFHLVAVLFGAPVAKKTIATSAWALLMSALVTIPTLVTLGEEVGIQHWLRVLFLGQTRSLAEMYCYCQLATTLLGAWLAAFVILLDWNRPWQVWPVSSCVGTVVGSVVAVPVSWWAWSRCSCWNPDHAVHA